MSRGREKGCLTWMKGKYHTKNAIRKIKQARAKQIITEKHKQNLSIANKGQIPWIKGKKHSIESRKKMSESRKSKIFSETHRKNLSNSSRGKPKPWFLGQNHPNWKGGKWKYYRNREMGQSEYINWRRLVFQRDGFTCQYCGEIGGDLNAHHKKRWKDYPELRYEVDNGITLCKFCHIELHKKIQRWVGVKI